jgi:hypothetical protein
VTAPAPVRLPRIPRSVLALTVAGAAVVGAWALWPIRSVSLDNPDLSVHKAPAAATELPVLQASAFRAPLWVAQAPPPPPPPAPQPPPPLKLQLIAIVHENGEYRAALYDPDSDELKVVSTGDKLGSRTVTSVIKDSVTISEGKLIRTLALDVKPRSAP